MKLDTPRFIGARLREAREVRGLTQTRLAELLEITKQAVSLYERATRSTPSPTLLAKIVEVLDLSATFFVTGLPRPPSGVVFYRSMSTATKTARRSALRKYEWGRLFVDHLRQWVELPAANFPNLRAPNDPASLSGRDIENAAAGLRAAWNLGEGPIGNLVSAIENNGGIVVRRDLGAATLDAFSDCPPNDLHPHIVLGSGKGSAVRSRFDAAHELAHILLHQGIDESTLADTARFRLVEKQANHFAGALLLPEGTFAEDFYAATLNSLRMLKGKWKVAIAAMIHRAGRLKLISEEQERRLWINMSRRRWRTHEPLDDELPPEEPRMIVRAVNLLKERGIPVASNFEAQFGLRGSDIEDAAGLPPGTLSTERHPVLSIRFRNDLKTQEI